MPRGSLVVAILGLPCVVAGTSCSPDPSATGSSPERAGEVQDSTFDFSAKAVTITFGRLDKEPSEWAGSVSLSEGRLLDVRPLRRVPGDFLDASGRFRLQAVDLNSRGRSVSDCGLALRLDAPDSAVVTVANDHRDFSFRLGDLELGKPYLRLRGNARIELAPQHAVVAASEHDETAPAAVVDADGRVFLAYVRHAPIGPRQLRPVAAVPGSFRPTTPPRGGDRLVMRSWDGSRWDPEFPVTAADLDVAHPAVVVQEDGRVCVIWSQIEDGRWDLFARRVAPGSGAWSEVQRLTDDAGADLHPVVVRASSGRVWLAWQDWQESRFRIGLAELGDEGLRNETSLGPPDANSWTPAIAADASGRIFVAYDSYDTGSYDVLLSSFAEPDGEAVTVSTWRIAGSPAFEARPSLASTPEGLWIAWEERAESWGLDCYGGERPGPGNPLYGPESRVRVARWEDGHVTLAPPIPSPSLVPEVGRGLMSHPRLGSDAGGRLWLTFRQRGMRYGVIGTFWSSYLTRLEGGEWAGGAEVPLSENAMDVRPAMTALQSGHLMLVYCGDGRVSRASRPQDVNNDLFAAVVRREDAPAPIVLPEAPVAAALVDAAPATGEPGAGQRAVERMRSYVLEQGGRSYRPLRGDLHRHTDFSVDSDRDGCLEDMWRYGLDVAELDWMCNSDHDAGEGRENPWWVIQQQTEMYHHAPRFLTIFGYERSVDWPDGHRNVYFARRGIRILPRLLPSGEERSPSGVSTGDTTMLYDYLRELEGICISHTPATDFGTDWRQHDGQLEPVVEIYQGCRECYERAGAPRAVTPDENRAGYRPDGFIDEALRKGFRLGFIASSDHESTHISYAVVFAEEVSREGILDALRRRHCYGATDDILLVVTSGDHLMGDEFVTNEFPTLQIEIAGTAALARVVVFKDQQPVVEQSSPEPELSLRWEDADATPGEAGCYYVRVEQEDGQLAWSSPLWISYDP